MWYDWEEHFAAGIITILGKKWQHEVYVGSCVVFGWKVLAGWGWLTNSWMTSSRNSKSTSTLWPREISDNKAFSVFFINLESKKKDPNVLDVFIKSRAGQAKTSLVKVSRKMVHYCWTKVPDTHAIWLVDAGIFKERSKAVAFTWWGMATEWTFSMLLHPFRTVMLGKKKNNTHAHSNLGHIILDRSSTSDLSAG